jgi:protein-L-isoaspartate(D-aspartate) O-methyltransferase
MQDLPYHKGERLKLVRVLQEKGIKNPHVLKAISRVPRHLFFGNSIASHAYEDKAFPIASGQTISQPYTVAYQTELLDVSPGMKVLEIGTGSGYQAAILMDMGANVYTIERIKELFNETKHRFQELGYRPKYQGYGDGYKGLPLYAPFDRIIVTAAAPYIPEALIEQLKPGGKLVIPVGIGKQRMKLITKNINGEIQESDHGLFRFVPMLKNKD